MEIGTPCGASACVNTRPPLTPEPPKRRRGYPMNRTNSRRTLPAPCPCCPECRRRIEACERAVFWHLCGAAAVVLTYTILLAVRVFGG